MSGRRSAILPLRSVGSAARSTEWSTFAAATTPLYDDLVRRLVLIVRNREDAEDIAQEAMLRALKAWDRFDGVNVRGWLYTIAIRLAFNQLRRRRRWLRYIQRPWSLEWTDHVDPDMWIALGRLDPRVRAALLLNVLDGYTQREIGVMLGVPEGTVSSWLARARSRLRDDLGSPLE